MSTQSSHSPSRGILYCPAYRCNQSETLDPDSHDIQMQFPGINNDEASTAVAGPLSVNVCCYCPGVHDRQVHCDVLTAEVGDCCRTAQFAALINEGDTASAITIGILHTRDFFVCLGHFPWANLQIGLDYLNNVHKMFFPCWFNARPSSTTLAQHASNIGRTSRICWDIHLGQNVKSKQCYVINENAYPYIDIPMQITLIV